MYKMRSLYYFKEKPEHALRSQMFSLEARTEKSELVVVN